MNEEVFKAYSKSPIGGIVVTTTIQGVTSVNLIGNSQTEVETTWNKNPSLEKLASQTINEILEYLNGNRKDFAVQLDWSKVKREFQKRVLTLAMNIPFGETKTYGEIAHFLGNDKASRAVGAALGSNPLPLLIPCHRVVATSGHLTGFSAADGVRTKQFLLELEGHRIEHQKLV